MQLNSVKFASPASLQSAAVIQTAMSHRWLRWSLLLLAFCLSLLLSGCVDYQVGVTFDNPNQGKLVQHIQLSDQLTALNNQAAQQWLDNFERRTRKLQGRVQRVSRQELWVTIPFSTGAELATKFNQFFQPTAEKPGKAAASIAGLPELQSQMKLVQNNLLLWQRARLVYDLDLRSLSLGTSESGSLLNSDTLLDLEFSLTTPWGARSVDVANALQPKNRRRGHQLVWQLKPGRVNHLEAVFWMPSPLGFGTVAIAVLVLGGVYVKSRLVLTPTSESTALPEGQ